MSRLRVPEPLPPCPTCEGDAHVRVVFPHFVSLECNACGKRWAADRLTGAYVCSLDDFESPHGTALDPPEPIGERSTLNDDDDDLDVPVEEQTAASGFFVDEEEEAAARRHQRIAELDQQTELGL